MGEGQYGALKKSTVVEFRGDSNSPTPNRNTNKLLMSGGMKMSQPQTKKSINGGIKNQRDSMADVGSNQQPNDLAPVNFYELP